MVIEEYCGEQGVNEINKLVAKSFGRKFRGDIYVNDFWMSGLGGPEVRANNDKLEGIGAPSSRLRYFFTGKPHVDVGKFVSEDGSILEVKSKYMGRAQKYAILYFEKFKRKVKISVDNDAGVPVNLCTHLMEPIF